MDAKEERGNGSMAGTLRYLSAVAGRTKLGVVALMVLQVVSAACGVFYALFLREIINAAVAGDRHRFLVSVGGFCLLVCVQIALRATAYQVSEMVRARLDNSLKSRLFSALLRKDYGSVTAVHTGEWMNRLTSDTLVVTDGMTQILPSLSGMVVRMTGAIVLIVVLEPRFLWLVIPVGLLMMALSYSFRKVMKRMHKNIQEKDGRLRVFMQETLGSMLVVRSFGVEEGVGREARERMVTHKRARLRRNRFANFCNTGFSVLLNGSYVAGAFYCGYGIMAGTMSYGTFMAVLQLISQIQYPFANISGLLPRYYAMLASAERLMEAEELPEPDNGVAYTPREIQDIYAGDFRSIGVEGASFTYMPPVRDSHARMPITLRDISVEIRKKEYVAIVGPSGCGKSTLLKLLMCLYPLDGGTRYVRRLGSVEPLTVRWQKLFAYVPQGNHLMSGTIREIVAFADREHMHDEARISHALRAACAEEFVSELDDGVDTVLGERGLGLSEGQMQRLAIARAVFSGFPILLLDECTSALDEATEKRLLNGLRQMTDKTVLIVTHRPAALGICDKVLDLTFASQGGKDKTI